MIFQDCFYNKTAVYYNKTDIKGMIRFMKPAFTPVVIAVNGQEIKQHGTSEFPCAFYSVFHGSQVPWHWHDEFECAVVHHGSICYNTPQGRIVLNAGDGIFLNSGTLHGTDISAENTCQKSDLVFHGRLIYGTEDSVFYKKYVRRLLEPDAPQMLVLRKNAAWHGELLEKIKKAARLCQNKPEGYEFSVRSLLSELLFDLYCYSEAPSNESCPPNSSEHERIKQMLLYLQENYAHPVTVAELAAHASICERECLRCFKNMLQLSPIQYLIRYRIARACALLREGDMSVLEISSRCGFESPSYFTKTFRKVTGCTPTEYRSNSRRQ